MSVSVRAVLGRGAVAASPVVDETGSGWSAELVLRLARRRGRTIVASQRRQGPLMIQRAFHPEGDPACHLYLLHPPAGIVGGDELAVSLELEDGAHALVTTPGATRWYFSRGIRARLQQSARVGRGARLEWLPQETLFFDGADAEQRTRIELDGDARFCGWEMIGLGRPALEERFRSGSLDLLFELSRDGQPLLSERQRTVTGSLPGLRDYAAYATFVATHADEEALAAVRRCLMGSADALCAATLIDDLLIVRGLAARCEPLRRALVTSWSTLRPRLLNAPGTPPRIWRT